MLVLWERDELTVTEIGERLFLDSATLTPLLKRLDLAGLLQRVRAIDDERQVIVSLTAKGHTLQAMAQKVPESVLCTAHSSPSAIVPPKQALEKLRKRLLKHI